MHYRRQVTWRIFAVVLALFGVRQAWEDRVWSQDVGAPAAATANLVGDGSFEQITRHAVFRWPYLEKALKSGVQVTREGEEAVLPANFSQFIGTKTLKMVEGRAGEEVHSGTRAILLEGGLYLRPATPLSYRTREGDLYAAEFYAKGSGDVSLWLHVYGTGKTHALRVETKGKPSPSQWTKIEQAFLIVGPGAEEIFPRLDARQPILIDGLVLRKTSSAGEPSVEVAYPSPRERSKALFVYPVRTLPTVDGKLDDPCWQEIPGFSAFLSYGHQSVLAEPTTTVRMGYGADSLFVGIACREPDLSILSLLDPYQDLATEQWIGPTALEVFLDPGRSRLKYFQFAVTAGGHKYDGLGMDGAWNTFWEAKAAVGQDGYNLEIRIPFASLAVRPPSVGDVWGLNVCRHRDTTHSTWAPVGPNFHQPAGFGQMVFGSFDQWYREAFLSGSERRRVAILERAAQLKGLVVSPHDRPAALAEFEERLRLVDAYAAEVKTRVEKEPTDAPKDWRRIADLYGMGGVALDAYGRILTGLDWTLLGARR